MNASVSPYCFQQDLDFLAEWSDPVLLRSPEGQAQVAVVPEFQGRVMTSSARGPQGASYGWINYELIRSGARQPHINVYGGEDRFWIGPEGGQFAIFFEPDSPFDFDHWQTPAVIDTDAFAVSSQSDTSVAFAHQASVRNWSGFAFSLGIERTIELLDRERAGKILGLEIEPALSMVGYQSLNRLTNIGDQPWRPETGLLSIWILGMYKPSPHTTIVVPFAPGPERELGPRVNADYFGPVPARRLVLEEDVLFYLGDGEQRGKIGIPPARARELCGSYDPDNGVLTVVHYNFPGPDHPYVNSMWEMQVDPFAGDVVNSYNDGPPEPGADPLGPFYELETSSPALALEPRGAAEHLHQTFHFEGTPARLDPIARRLFGVSVDRLGTIFSIEGSGS